MGQKELSIRDLVAFMEAMGLENMNTERDMHGYRFYVTVEKIKEDDDDE